nr:zinc finger protein CONSTANS-LIKE 16 [Ipomoea trifida]
MMSFDNQRKTANAISGKTARACDSCLWKRARWFCVADDAFLCQSCDVSVHSANLLASRHQRVRLGTSSSSSSTAATLLSSPKCNQVVAADDDDDESPPAWHRGFTRKPRTPRNAKRTKKQNSGAGGGVAAEESVNPLLPLVPEMGSDDDYNNNEIDPEQLFCQVPVLLDDDLNALLNDSGGDDHMRGLEIPEFLSSDMELAEFAADVETLLGDDDVEDKATAAVKIEINGDDCTEALNWSFGEEQEVEQKVMMRMLSGLDEESSSMESGSCKEEVKKSRMLLSLNYEEVISAWASQGCPWTDGTRPHFDPNHCWPDFMGGDHYNHHPYGTAMMMRRSDEGREARVSRYREKRRTRLFSKKIRYEVRKLNAEKRPRLKGRFVKRASLFQPPPPFPNYLLNRHL